MLTVGQLKEIIRNEVSNNRQVKQDYTAKKYAFGLRGIREEFNVSHATAQKYKDGILKDAVMQNGRKIILDVHKARKLFALNDCCLAINKV